LARRWPELSITAAALVLFSWATDVSGWGNAFYAAAVRSMTTSWSNFFYASLDPGGWVTVDKPPAALWLQALSAKVFGFSSWSILLPSAVCGALAVWLLMSCVREAWGRTAGLVAGGVLALTPMVVAVNRSNNPDALLVLTAVAAAWAVQRGIRDGRWRWMIWAGVFCGIGFLTKLLAAGLVMPALWLAFLVAAPGSWRKRLMQCLAGGLVFALISAAWIGIIAAVPLSNRPWIGGSTDGSALDLVLGYNGVGRINGSEGGIGGGPGGGGGGFGAPGGFGGQTASTSGASGVLSGLSDLGGTGSEFGGTPGPLRLFNTGMGDQVMWLAPLAAASALAGAAIAWRRRRRDARLGSLIMWIGWAGVTYVTFAYASGVFHNYYTAQLAPALAALVGIGVALVIEGGRLLRLAAVGAIVATAALQVALLDRVASWEWLRVAVPAVVLAAGVAAVVLALGSPRWRKAGLVAIGAGGVVLLAAPAAWSLSGLHEVQSTFPQASPQGGSGLGAGPGGGGGPGGFPGGGGGFPGGGANGFPGGGRRSAGGDTTGANGDSSSSASGGQLGGFPGGVGQAGAPGGGQVLGNGGPGGGSFSTAELDWLNSQRGDARWILAVSSSMEADQPIIDGYDVVALGGFSGSDGSASLSRVADAVASGELRFIAAGGGGGGGFGGPGGGGYAGAVAQVCTPVSATSWGGTGSSSVYDCQGKADQLRAAASSSSATGRSRSGGGSAGNGSSSGGSGSGGYGNAGGGGPASGSDGFDMQAMQTCLAEHGLDLSNGAPDMNDPSAQAAFQDCAVYLPNGGSGGPGGFGPPGASDGGAGEGSTSGATDSAGTGGA
jgi:4-amino-4-deoxy-L-arabinose transferase-like glycosyltransferase